MVSGRHCYDSGAHAGYSKARIAKPISRAMVIVFNSYTQLNTKPPDSLLKAQYKVQVRKRQPRPPGHDIAGREQEDAGGARGQRSGVPLPDTEGDVGEGIRIRTIGADSRPSRQWERQTDKAKAEPSCDGRRAPPVKRSRSPHDAQSLADPAHVALHPPSTNAHIKAKAPRAASPRFRLSTYEHGGGFPDSFPNSAGRRVYTTTDSSSLPLDSPASPAPAALRLDVRRTHQRTAVHTAARHPMSRDVVQRHKNAGKTISRSSSSSISHPPPPMKAPIPSTLGRYHRAPASGTSGSSGTMTRVPPQRRRHHRPGAPHAPAASASRSTIHLPDSPRSARGRNTAYGRHFHSRSAHDATRTPTRMTMDKETHRSIHHRFDKPSRMCIYVVGRTQRGTRGAQIARAEAQIAVGTGVSSKKKSEAEGRMRAHGRTGFTLPHEYSAELEVRTSAAEGMEKEQEG
ncbi:hypothetical protein B0H16DRAFT_1699516 [Mycena metata]|uniref:Uncharacterized protein n=1 Tax=Mycena metata TaxID=1033252 RepID=A0AAD7HIT3_9AGAR|nr:hypothetical protein B0H16DRAFT_1699516 [Mycena metata]